MNDAIRYILYPLEIGNPVASVERLSELIKSNKISHSKKPKLIKVITERILSHGIFEKERSEIITLLLDNKICRSNSNFIKVLNNLTCLKNNEIEKTGTANCLFVANGSDHGFGCIHPITATAIKDGKGDVKILVSELKEEISLSVSVVREAVRYYLHQKGLSIKGFYNFNNYSFSIQIGSIDKTYDGTSLCLSTAVAIMSQLLEKPVNQKIAFTGTVRNTGAIEKVTGIDEKIKVAIQKEIEKVYIPADNLSNITNIEGITILSKPSIGNIFEDIFEKDNIDRFIQTLNASAGEGTVIPAEKVSERVLISIVGNRDPYGAPFNKPDELSEGAILTAFRRITPDTVCLIATKGTEKNAVQTKEVIEAITGPHNCKVEIRTIEVKDPTDYDELYISILYSLQSIKDLLQNKQVFLSLSSGTPQMHAVLINLLQTKKLLAHLIQVREPRYVDSWDDRVKIVKSEYLGIGQ